MKKELTFNQQQFKKKVLEELKPILEWYNDYLNFRFEFEDDNFHLHIIEDYCCHLHVRGILDDDGSIYQISSTTNHSVSKDIYDEVMRFIEDMM